MSENVNVPDGFAAGAAAVSCDREVAAAGLIVNDSTSTTLPAAAFDAENPGERFHILPLVADGGGFRSQLLVTNLAPGANSCLLGLYGPGLDGVRFAPGGGAAPVGAGVTLDMTRAGAQLALSSEGGAGLAFGYATLDCDEPAAAANLLSVGPAERPAGMAAIPGVWVVDAFRFPVVPGAGSLAFVFSNPADAAASCAVGLRENGGAEVSGAAASVPVPARSTAVRFFADLFAAGSIPDDFDSGAADVACVGAVSAVALPLSGAVFAAMPPVVFSAAARDTAAPSFPADAVEVADLHLVKGEPMTPVTFPEAFGGDGELRYTLEPALPPGLRFDPAARTLSGTPTAEMAETVYTYAAADADFSVGPADAASLRFSIAVTRNEAEPAFPAGSAVDDLRLTPNEAMTPLALPEAEVEVGGIAYSLTPDVPGLSFDGATRRLSGTPTEIGDYPMRYAATGDTGLAAALLDPAGCEDGRYVADAENRPGLVRDCRALAAFANEIIETGLVLEDNVLRQWGRGAREKVEQWEGVSASSGRVRGINLASRGLKGGISPELGHLTELGYLYLYLYDNQLSGSIPPELGQLSALTVFYLSDNQLSGSIPPELGEIASLATLILDNNQLSGPIPPELGQLKNLEKLILWSNNLTGEIPSELGHLTELRDLYLYDNQLSDPIPPELGRLSSSCP